MNGIKYVSIQPEVYVKILLKTHLHFSSVNSARNSCAKDAESNVVGAVLLSALIAKFMQEVTLRIQLMALSKMETLILLAAQNVLYIANRAEKDILRPTSFISVKSVNQLYAQIV